MNPGSIYMRPWKGGGVAVSHIPLIILKNIPKINMVNIPKIQKAFYPYICKKYPVLQKYPVSL